MTFLTKCYIPVKLVKAGPGPGLREPLEELSHGMIVQAVRAVEHDTLLAGSLLDH